MIDRRFYRRKYDAAQAVAGFGATLRDEINLESLAALLVDVVDDTLQAEAVTVWLAPAAKRLVDESGRP